MSQDVPIKQGRYSYFLAGLAFLLLLFSYVYISKYLSSIYSTDFVFALQLTLDIFFALLLIIGGLVLARLGKLVKVSEDEETPENQNNILLWFVVSLGMIVIMDLFTPFIPLSTVQLTTLYAGGGTVLLVVYGVLIAVGEEEVFRGWLGNVFLTNARSAITGSMGDGAMFTVYHLFRYGDSAPAIIVVFVAGTTLTYADYRSRYLITSELAHVTNNIGAAGLQITRPIATVSLVLGLGGVYFVPVIIMAVPMVITITRIHQHKRSLGVKPI